MELAGQATRLYYLSEEGKEVLFFCLFEKPHGSTTSRKKARRCCSD